MSDRWEVMYQHTALHSLIKRVQMALLFILSIPNWAMTSMTLLWHVQAYQVWWRPDLQSVRLLLDAWKPSLASCPQTISFVTVGFGAFTDSVMECMTRNVRLFLL